MPNTTSQPVIKVAPTFNDRAFEGVLSRRIFAFFIDYVVMALVIAVLGTLIGVLGVLTFGIAWLLYAVLVPIVVVPYVALSLGGRDHTDGMRGKRHHKGFPAMPAGSLHGT